MKKNVTFTLFLKVNDEDYPRTITPESPFLTYMGYNITNRQIMYSESEQLYMYLKSRALSYITTFKKT